MIRLAHISGDIRKNKISGPRESITQLSKEICNIGHSAEIFSVNEDCFTYNSFQVKNYKNLDISEFDVVVFVGVYFRQYLPLLFKALLLKKKVIVSPRSNLMKASINHSFKKKLYLWLISPMLKKTILHFLSDEERNNSFFNENKYYISGNGVDSSKVYTDIPSNKSTEYDSVVIGYMGRLDVAHKGIDILFDALKLLNKTKVKLLIYGPVHRGVSLEMLFENVSDNIEICYSERGLYSAEEKNDFFSSIDFFIHMSRYEGVPQSVLESISNGKPVIVSKGTNLTKLVNDNNLGFSFNTSSNELADVIVKSAKVSSNKYLLMSHDCISYSLENLSWNKQAKYFMEGVINE
ncbi:glycosyltransferase family 4 protein [Vibrio fluvialis]|nr:glycosyltransferase family 4 protein [Vibrio fluvialis]MBY8052210.1 glycosyltransferase family 4 protein [Vibrio fluvialis]